MFLYTDFLRRSELIEYLEEERKRLRALVFNGEAYPKMVDASVAGHESMNSQVGRYYTLGALIEKLEGL